MWDVGQCPTWGPPKILASQVAALTQGRVAPSSVHSVPQQEEGEKGWGTGRVAATSWPTPTPVRSDRLSWDLTRGDEWRLVAWALGGPLGV